MCKGVNVTFIKRNPDDEILDVICVNGFVDGLSYPYIGNTLSLEFQNDNTHTSTFDGGSGSFDILTEHIKRVTGNLISETINTNLTSAPISGFMNKGAAITPYEEEFIEKIKQFEIDISNSSTSDTKNLLRMEFARELLATYENDTSFKSALPKIKQFLAQNQQIQKIITDNFYIEGIAGRRAFGKGSIRLDQLFSPLFPYRSLGGEHRRKTIKKYT
jgi:hypothetical protein